MMIWKRAIRYVTRKRSKCLLLFMMLFIIGVFILSTLTVKRTLRVSEEHLRESIVVQLSRQKSKLFIMN